MAKYRPDYSLERGGLSLGEWLWLLVGDSREDRIKAAEAIESMYLGRPSLNLDWHDFEEIPKVKEQSVRFAEGVRAALAHTEFDTRLFIQKLCNCRLAAAERSRQESNNRCQYLSIIDDKYDRILKKIDQRYGSPADCSMSLLRERRLQRLLDAYSSLSEKVFVVGPNPASYQSILGGIEGVVSLVISLLSQEFISAPESLEAILNDKFLRFTGLAALERIGPPAIAFAPLLIQGLDNSIHVKSTYCFDGARALGAIGQGDETIVSQMIDRLRNDDIRIRSGAADVLHRMGRNVCGREREICDLLLPMFDGNGMYDVVTLAAVGCDLPDVRKKILEIASPRPAQWIDDAYSSEGKYDKTMRERATAISAMKYLTAYPEECIPILIDAIDTFEEFDPDETYNGPIERVATVLGEFGESATGAVTSLLDHLADEDQDFPKSILDALAKIGAGAKDAIPHLHKFRKTDVDEPISNIETDVIDRSADQVGWTIQQIIKASND